MANSCISDSNCANGVVSVLLGNGDGTFHPAVSYGSGGSLAQSVAVEDVNRDGKLDLVVANYCASGIACFISSSPTGVLGVLMGNGDGTFQPVVGYGSGGYAAYTLAIGDLNGDGKPDLVVANRCSSFACTNSGGIGVLLGQRGWDIPGTRNYFNTFASEQQLSQDRCSVAHAGRLRRRRQDGRSFEWQFSAIGQRRRDISNAHRARPEHSGHCCRGLQQ